MSLSRWIWLLVASVVLVLLVWSTLRLWRWQAVRDVYTAGASAPSAVSPQHIAALRKMRVSWNARIEGGGPVIDSWTPYGSADMADDLGPIIGTDDGVAIARFHREVSSVLIDALKHCELGEGTYRLKTIDNAWMEERLRRELAGLPPARIEAIVAEMPRLQPDQSFHFTAAHCRLLRSLAVEWPDDDIIWIAARGGYPAPVVDFKRPFGEMTAFERDMAAIVGRPMPTAKARDLELERLYWEMWPALQTFIEYARIEPDAGGGAP